ncbi:MAG TPA: Uma2 family endonuclease [Acidimicrobiales bacterium]|nr:Uma2 family endonuclease [Acidimicrobiales bacterium]
MSDGQGITVSEWHTMSEAAGGGILRELLDGDPVVRAPMTPAHADCVVRIHQLVESRIGEDAVTQMHRPIVLDPRSETRPDIAVLARPEHRTAGSHALLLVIEVADSSHGLIYGRGRKAAYYARCGVADCWIVDLLGQQVLVHSSPASGGYREIRNLRRGATLSPSSLPNVNVTVDEVLGVAGPAPE